MSLKTWKEEFYQKNPSKKMSTLEAVEHSLQKWEGLRKQNLKKHEIRPSWDNREIRNDKVSENLEISTKTCALCVKFYDEDYSDVDSETCTKCPLYISRGGYACDKETPDEDELDLGEDIYNKHPFSRWCDSANPMPMIKELKKTLKMIKKQEEV